MSVPTPDSIQKFHERQKQKLDQDLEKLVKDLHSSTSPSTATGSGRRGSNSKVRQKTSKDSLQRKERKQTSLQQRPFLEDPEFRKYAYGVLNKNDEVAE